MKYFCTVIVRYNTTKRAVFAAREIIERFDSKIVEAEAPIAVVRTILDDIASRANQQYDSKYKIEVCNPIRCLSENYLFSVEARYERNIRDVAEVKMIQVKGEVKGGER